MADPIIPDDSISGNKVHGGVISEFQSTGIQDLATQTSLVVSNGTATVDRIRTKTIDGNVTVNGNMSLTGSITVAENVNFNKDISILGTISADTISVKNLVATVRQETREPLTFVGMSPTDLAGKGLVWKVGNQLSTVLYKNGKLAFTIEPDLAVSQAYHVAGAPVLSQDTLGPTVVNSKLKQVGRLQQLTVDGKVDLNGKVDITRDVDVDGNVKITGTLEAQVIKASQVVTDDGGSYELGNFTADSEAQLNGKGINWISNSAEYNLVYRTGGRIWTNGAFDLSESSAYNIDATPVLSLNELGSTVTKSNLQEVGKLKTLTVRGDSALGDFAFFNSNVNRLGLGTDEPNGTLAIVDYNNEFVVYSGRDNVMSVGTYTNTDLEIITDNLPRFTVKNNGQVIFGSENNSNADVRIHGTLTVDTVVSDNRIDRYQPLEFKTSRDRGIYGQGLVWSGTGNMRQFIMMASPDRLWSTESIDLAEDQSYMINGKSVISSVGLGPNVTQSNLSKVGTLEVLNVAGEATFMDRINASRAVLNAKTILFNDGAEFTISNGTLSSNRKISLDIVGQEKFYADRNEITIGDKQNTRTPVKVFGQLTVGINTPPEGVDFAVSGNIQFANKKFVTDLAVPTSGSFNKGDICWNSNPTVDNFVGWVCIESGAPGQWLPFGAISRQ